MEFFVPPDENDKWYEFWKAERFNWYLGLGIREDKLRMREHEAEELGWSFRYAPLPSASDGLCSTLLRCSNPRVPRKRDSAFRVHPVRPLRHPSD